MSATQQPLVIRRTLDAPIELVWKALSDASLLKKWQPYFTDFRPEVGFKTQFRLGAPGTNTYMHTCEVTEVIPGQKLTYSWRYDGIPGDSYVTFALTSLVPDKTVLTLTHRITEPFPQDNPDFTNSNFATGWTRVVTNLEAHIKHLHRSNHEPTTNQ